METPADLPASLPERPARSLKVLDPTVSLKPMP